MRTSMRTKTTGKKMRGGRRILGNEDEEEPKWAKEPNKVQTAEEQAAYNILELNKNGGKERFPNKDEILKVTNKEIPEIGGLEKQ